MSKEEYKQLYENMKANSIGQDKKCKYIKEQKKAILKISLKALAITLIGVGLVGCNYNNNLENNNTTSYSAETDDYEQYGYEICEIDKYSILRFHKILQDNNFTDYKELADGKLEYNYTAADYQSLEGFDDTYIYDAINITTPNTVNEMVQALGYENVEDYYQKKGYINSKGQIKIEKMAIEHLNDISKIMYEKIEGKGNAK